MGSSPPFPLPGLSSRRRRVVPTVLQMEVTECGAACLAMILGHYGRWVPLEELRVSCGVSRDGSNALNIVRAARELGLKARGVRCGSRRAFDLPLPLIAHWAFNHFVVVEGVRGDRVYINDPSEGPRTVRLSEFEQSFSGVCILFEKGPEFRRGGRRPGALRGVLSRLGHATNRLLYAVLCALVLIVPGIAFATLAKVFVDEVLVPRSDALMVPLLIGLGVVAGVQGVLTWLRQWSLAHMETHIATVTTTRFFLHLFTLPMTFFAQRHAGDIAHRVMSNDRVAQLVCGDLATGMVSLVTMLAYGAVLLAYDPLLFLAVLAMTSVNVVALLAIGRAREDGSRRLLKEQAWVASTSVNGLSMIETLKADGSEGRFFARWAGQHVNAVAALQSLGILTNVLNVVPPLISSLTTILILGFGGFRMLEGAITVGGLVAFQLLAQSFSRPVEQLVAFSAQLQTLKADIARLDDVLHHAPEVHATGSAGTAEASQVPRTGRSLVLDEVTFGYNAKEPPVIEGFSLEIPPGHRVALVGRSGSGKSTVAKLACRLLSPWSGTVRIGGVGIADLPPERLSALVSYVDQDIVIFDGTVRDNVTLWNRAIDDQAVTQALRDATLLDEVTKRPGNYDTPVGENGHRFSGGQRQLLEIARAIVSDPEILVLDEATANLDPVTEIHVDDHLRRRGVTSLIVAHRLSTVRDADEIVVLEQGRIVERGTHDALVARGGAYTALIASE